MIDLLRADLKRAFKDKLVIVLCVIGGIFAVSGPLLYKAIFWLLGSDQSLMQELEMLGLSINAKTLFFNAFAPNDNFGLILPIFVAIIMCRDFNHGTIRNKIICGKSRVSIYFSMLITCAVLICTFIFAHAILTLLASLIFFDFQSTKFTASDLGYTFASIGMELLVYLLISAVLVLFIVLIRRTGLAIVLYFVFVFSLTIVGAITSVVSMFIEADAGAKVVYAVIEFLDIANAFNGGIGVGTTYKLKEVLFFVLPNVALIAGVILLALFSFKKKDLK
ncbi:MAG: hypothetical protein IKZ38_02635 [Clostridia bacterium]|nr:hypothetical protein [Clostridia bacterium]